MSGYESGGQVPHSSLSRRGRRWMDVAVSAGLMLAVSIPTMAIEEDWHGRPMIDQPSHLWIIAGCLVAAAFFVGGAVAAHRRPSAPLMYAMAAAVLAVTVLLVGAISRRFWIAHSGVPIAVARLWLFGAAVALLMSAVGSLLGRRFSSDAAESPV